MVQTTPATASQSKPGKKSASKLVSATGRRPPRAGMGRPAGSKNKLPAQLKEMILTALDKAGGAKYLEAQAKDNPGPFLALLGKVLPTTLAGDPSSPIVIQLVQFGGD